MKNSAIRISSLAFFVWVAVSPVITYAAGSKAVLLSAANIFKPQGIICGYLRRHWVPGTLTKNNRFFSYQAERAYLLQQARVSVRKKRAKLLVRARELKALIVSQSPVCSIGRRAYIQKKRRLKFNFSGAIGLALRQNVAVTSSLMRLRLQADNYDDDEESLIPESNLDKVDPDGVTEPAVESGKAEIEHIQVAPNGKVYVVFKQRTMLDSSSSDSWCVLAEIDKDSGEPTCVDSTLSSIDWSSGFLLQKIQFDAAGAVYYIGKDIYYKTVLRKQFNGIVTDFIDENVYLSSYFVLPDGTILISGTTKGSNAQWVRRINLNGSISTVYSQSISSFMYAFPNSNVFMGLNSLSGSGVSEYDVTSGSLKSPAYMALDTFEGKAPVHALRRYCSVSCETGADISLMLTTTKQEVFGLSQYYSSLVKYYPEVGVYKTSVKKAYASTSIGDNIVLSGLAEANGKYITVLLDAKTFSETQLIGPDNEIEIYHLNPIVAENSLLFDGLRFSDNKYVIGKLKLDTMELTFVPTGSSKFSDFVTFSS